MRKFLPYLQTITIFLAVATLFLMPSFAFAQETKGWDAALDFFSVGSTWLYGIIGKLFWWFLIPITGMILNLVGLLVDSALILSLTREFYMSPAIVEGWGVIRDLCNILFIFVLVFTGIKTILSLDTADTRRIVVSVIIGAVLINFSLFLTRAAIDVSNIFTAWITQGIKDLGDSGGVSDATVAVLSMQKLAEQQKEFSVTSFQNFGLSSFATGVALLALNCIAIYVLFRVAFLMFGRLVSFILLMITAPIGFVGHLVPKLEQYAKDWRDELTKACLMAPMFLLMLYITLFMATKFGAVLEKVAGQAVQGSTNDLLGANFGIAQYSLFIIVAMLMLKSLKVAEEYTGAIAGQIGGIVKNAAGVALGGVVGASAYVSRIGARSTVAALTNNAATSGRSNLQAFTSTARQNIGAPIPEAARVWTSEGRKALGKTIQKTISTGSMDIRDVTSGDSNFISGLQGVASGKTNINIGKFNSDTTKQNSIEWMIEDFKKNISNPATPVAILAGMFKKIPVPAIGKLSKAQLTDARIINLLEPKHLQEIQKNMSDSDRSDVRTSIGLLTVAVPNDAVDRSQKWLNSGGGSAF